MIDATKRIINESYTWLAQQYFWCSTAQTTSCTFTTAAGWM